jgi:hypothetical protein
MGTLKTRPIHAAMAGLAGLVLLGFALLAGCSTHDEMTGPPVPNEPPDTRLEGQAPVSLDVGFSVHFSWGGADPDGLIRGYQFKLVRHGPEGSPSPAGPMPDGTAVLDGGEWNFTTGTEKTFVLGLANEDSGQPDASLYTLFVRAMDDRGEVDPTPARMSFNSSTLLPSIVIDRPPPTLSPEPQPAPPTAIFGFTGIDPDFVPDRPIKVRYLWKRALLQDHYVLTRYEFDLHVNDLLAFDDEAWSGWIPYASDPQQRVVIFPDQPARDEQDRQIIYLFAVQAMDTTGAVSLDRDYGLNARLVYISETLAPVLRSYEADDLGWAYAMGLGTVIAHEIVSGQVLEFSWAASAEAYAGTIEAYRWGWDLVDPDDENDPNWGLLPGNTAQHRQSPPLAFGSGIHTLTIQCWDNLDQMTRLTYIIEVIPVPDYPEQYPLLLVDDVTDRMSNAWPGQDGATPFDRDAFRDAFWEDVLAGSGGVEGFSAARDVFDTEVEVLGPRDLVNYRNVLWTTRFAQGNFIWDNFKPLADGSQPYNWLLAYQQHVGNLFLAGERAMRQFIEEKNWMVPWIFDTYEDLLFVGDQVYQVGFGQFAKPDGTQVLRGPLRYAYRAMGVSMLDHVRPLFPLYGQQGPGSTGSGARNPACVGVKGLVVDGDFKAAHLGGGGVFPDTIMTEAVIDWMDQRVGYRDSLKTWSWGGDEFYDGNITARPTAWSPQICDSGPCVEPMFRIYSRFDWVDDLHEAVGDPDWPATIYDTGQLEIVCGQYALDPQGDRTRTLGQVTGLIAHKFDDGVPSGMGNVLWGFDPYRFDHGPIEQAIHWVLGEHFGLVMRP